MSITHNTFSRDDPLGTESMGHYWLFSYSAFSAAKSIMFGLPHNAHAVTVLPGFVRLSQNTRVNRLWISCKNDNKVLREVGEIE